MLRSRPAARGAEPALAMIVRLSLGSSRTREARPGGRRRYAVEVRVGCIALVLAQAAGVGAPVAAFSASDRSLAELAEAYRSANREKAVVAVTLWGRERLNAEVRRFLEEARLEASAQRDATQLAAVALLADSALLDLGGGDSPRARRDLQSAARLMEVDWPEGGATAFARRFYLLAGLALHRGVELQAGYALLVQALRLDKDDPELITALGAITETVAALRQYERSPDSRDRSIARLGGYASEDGSGGSVPSASLSEAEARYEQAVALDPGLAEARLRLGRVRLLSGHAKEALPDFEWVAAEARRAGQRYLARLFEGRAREKLGDLAGAADAYRAATVFAPRAQTGLVALGRALGRLGDTAGALEALERASQPDARAQDPWWSYQMGQPERLDELLVELRRLVP
jgi:tetratricopeptide (TPR) repeat protein